MSEKIKSKKILSNISWSLAEKLLTDLVSGIVTIVLARLLLPSDYGMVSLVQIFITISTVFVTCGLGTALIQNKDAEEDQISTVFYTNILMGIVIYILLFLCAPYLARFKGNESLTSIIRVLGIKVPISSVYSMYHSYVQKRMEFKRFFFSSLIGTITAGVVGVIMAYKGFGAWALVCSTLIDQVMDCLFLFLSIKWLPNFKLNFSKTKKIFDFGFKTLFNELLSRVYNQLRPLIIGLKFSSADLAYSVKGKKLPEMADELTNAIVLKVMFPVFSELQNDKEELLNMLRSSISVSMFVLAPMMIGLAATAYNFVPVVLTENWNPCIPYIQIACFDYLISPLSSLNNKVMQAKGRSNTVLKLNAFSIILDLSFIIIVLIKFDSALILALSSLIHTIIMFNIYANISNHLIGYKPKMILNDIGLSLVSSFIMGLSVFFVGNMFVNKVVALIVQVVFGAMLYFILSLIFKNKSLIYALNTIKGIGK